MTRTTPDSGIMRAALAAARARPAILSAGAGRRGAADHHAPRISEGPRVSIVRGEVAASRLRWRYSRMA